MKAVWLTTVQCPQCNKIYITPIQLKQTVAGHRPILVWPREFCNGGDRDNPCGYDFRTIQVESFDIPIDKQTQNLIVGAKR